MKKHESELGYLYYHFGPLVKQPQNKQAIHKLRLLLRPAAHVLWRDYAAQNITIEK